MATTQVPRIEILRLPTMRPAQTDRQIFSLFRHSYKVYVIAHQAVSKNPHAAFATVFFEQIEIDAAVIERMENGLTIRSTLSDVMRKAGDDAAGSPWHTPG